MSEDIREEIARAVWESSIEFSNPHKERATRWDDVKISAARQHARHVADALMPLVARIQAEAFDEGWIERAKHDTFNRLRPHNTPPPPPRTLNLYRAGRLEQGDPS